MKIINLITSYAEKGFRSMRIVDSKEPVFLARKPKFWQVETEDIKISNDDIKEFKDGAFRKMKFSNRGIQYIKIVKDEKMTYCKLDMSETCFGAEILISVIKYSDFAEQQTQFETVLSLLEEGDKVWLLKDTQFWITKMNPFREDYIYIEGIDDQRVLEEARNSYGEEIELNKEYDHRQGPVFKKINGKKYSMKLSMDYSGEYEMLAELNRVF